MKRNKKRIGGAETNHGPSPEILSFHFYQDKELINKYYLIGNDNNFKYVVSMDIQGISQGIDQEIDQGKVSIEQKEFYIKFPRELVVKDLWVPFVKVITDKEITPVTPEELNLISKKIQAVPQNMIPSLAKVQSEFGEIVDNLLVVMTIGSQFKDFINVSYVGKQKMLRDQYFIEKLKEEHIEAKKNFKIESSNLEEIIQKTGIFILNEKKRQCQGECGKHNESACKKKCEDEILDQILSLFKL